MLGLLRCALDNLPNLGGLFPFGNLYRRRRAATTTQATTSLYWLGAGSPRCYFGFNISFELRSIKCVFPAVNIDEKAR
jgi:hypothetical protein